MQTSSPTDFPYVFIIYLVVMFAFFSIDFISGDRSLDFGGVLSRVFFDHTLEKTLRGYSVNTFAKHKLLEIFISLPHINQKR